MREPLCFVSGDWHCLVMPGQEKGFSPDWFDPGYWGAQAQAVSEGGRGGAWFVESSGQRWVLRHYHRGGLVAHLSRSSYVYLGMEQTRAFAELRLLGRLFESGLPVPEPVAAGVQRLSGFRYRAAILMHRLEAVEPLGATAGSLPLERWEGVGATVRRFHDAGLYHPDLNCFNILLSGEQTFLIDFDKARYRTGSSSGWQRQTLERLLRSLKKLPVEAWRGCSLDQAWTSLMAGYQSVTAS